MHDREAGPGIPGVEWSGCEPNLYVHEFSLTDTQLKAINIALH